MKTSKMNITEKRAYTSPSVEMITLDNDISLQLMSDPGTPGSGDEVYNAPQYFNNDPFKNTMA